MKTAWFVLSLLSVGSAFAEVDRAYTRAIDIRQAALAGDEQVAPLAAAQPSPMTAAELPLGVVEFVPMADAAGRRARARVISVIVFGALGAGLAWLCVVLVAMFPQSAMFYAGDPVDAALTIAMVVAMALVGIVASVGALWALWREWRIAGGIGFAADEWGLRRTRRRRRRVNDRIAWHEARAFYTARSWHSGAGSDQQSMCWIAATVHLSGRCHETPARRGRPATSAWRV